MGKTLRRSTLLVVLGAMTLGPWAAAGQGEEAGGVITEVKIGKGRVEIKSAPNEDWRAAVPLMTLRPGDAIRATEDATAEVVLGGGRGSLRVDAARPMFVVPPPPAAESRLPRARAVVDESLRFLASVGKPPTEVALVTRGSAKPPVILSPRNSPVFPGPLTFEWTGSRFDRSTVRVLGPRGVIVERTVTGARFEYPAEAPPLTAGVRYTFQLVSGPSSPQQVWFELVEPARAAAIRADLTALEREAGATLSPNSLAALRAGFLARLGLLHDARQTLAAAIARDPDEPTLHLLLGHVYTTAGLTELAAEEYYEAQFLLKQGEPVGGRR